jgi:hypothetical protein
MQQRKPFLRKIFRALVLFLTLLAAMPALEWLRFAQFASVDAKRGTYTNGNLGLWMEINRFMPPPWRSWACSGLLHREEQSMGGREAARAISTDNLHEGGNWKYCVGVW